MITTQQCRALKKRQRNSWSLTRSHYTPPNRKKKRTEIAIYREAESTCQQFIHFVGSFIDYKNNALEAATKTKFNTKNTLITLRCNVEAPQKIWIFTFGENTSIRKYYENFVDVRFKCL